MSGSATTGFRILDPGGIADPEAVEGVDLKEQELIELLRLMVIVRRADAEATALQRQGELAVYPPLLGQEAAQVGSAFALEAGDFVFPSYRELGAAVVRGVDLVDYLHFYRGTWHGGLYDPASSRFGMVAVPIATQLLHAAGYAMGATLDGATVVSLAYFGDGATSQGDFHEACNFAGVYNLPLVLLCQNNGWAISVPYAKQTRGQIYRRGEGYGFEGVRVDGNDVLATYLVTKKAIDKARAGGGPTLIEAVTYRMGPHSTADDAKRYQPSDEIEKWKALDPIDRYRSYLRAAELLDPEVEKRFDDEAAEVAAAMRKGIVGADPPSVDDMFRWVFAEPTATLERQQAEMLEELRLLEES